MREQERNRLVELLNIAVGDSNLTNKEVKIVADYLLDNGVVVPPYKVGTKVYATIGSLSLPIPYAVYEVEIQRYVLVTGGLVPVVKLKKGAVTYGEIHTSLDSLYATREEALAKMKGGESDA